MSTIWFWTLAGMLTTYAALDGYDLGVGALHLWLARDDHERRIGLNAIGPVWNGNEVWLIATGGMLVVTFPRVYAAAFSGFYLALIVVLWLLVLRGIAIEFRGQIGHALWSNFWDATFGMASLALTLLLGVALGNLVRGLPIGADGYFVGSFTLMLNPYAMLTGLLSLCVLSWHGLNFMRTKAEGELLARARRWSRPFWGAALGLALLATAATHAARPDMFANFRHYPIALALPILALCGFGWGQGWKTGGSDRRSFAGSTLAIMGLLGSAAATAFPNLLRSSLAPGYSLTVYNAASGTHGLITALVANGIALTVVVSYSIYIHRVFRGAVRLGSHSY